MHESWLYQNEWFFVRDVAAMDLRLGLVDNRVSPALAHKLGRLAADLPQQPAIQQLAEQFDVHFSVDTYRSVVESLERSGLCDTCRIRPKSQATWNDLSG